MPDYEPPVAFRRIIVDLHTADSVAADERARSLGLSKKAYITKLIRDDINAVKTASTKKGAKTK